MNTSTLLSTHQVCQAVGITRRILDHWIDRGAIQPHVARGGIGYARGYSADDVDRLDAINRVRRDLQAIGFDHIPASLVRDLWDGLDGADATELSHGTVTITVRRGLEVR